MAASSFFKRIKNMHILNNVRLGNSDLFVSRVGLGLWPIAGMTSLEVNDADSLATIEAAREGGINFFDTAYCYGADGVSERLLGRAIRHCREDVVIATKCGVHWAADLSRVNDASPARLKHECEESLRRLGIDQVDLLYLHSPDRITPIESSAAAMAELQRGGKAKTIGLSNATLDETQRFHAVCPLTVVQPRYNMFQREIEQDLVPWCQANGVSIVSYWPLMKGLLAGKIRRGHQFDPRDKRLSYPIFQPPQWERAQNLIDELEILARQADVTIAQLVVAWTIAQPGITSVLCGAKRPWQIAETLQAMNLTLTSQTISAINDAIARHLSA
jgi:aryl-alcohol dehydrogenase-like predicted oxidoreductase